jgi:hypothetical protein
MNSSRTPDPIKQAATNPSSTPSSRVLTPNPDQGKTKRLHRNEKIDEDAPSGIR